MKSNPNYKPDLKECVMYLRDRYKNGGTNLKGTMIFLKCDYPTLTDNEVKRAMKKFIEEDHIKIKED